MTQLIEGGPCAIAKNQSSITNDLSDVSWTFYHELSPGRVSPDADTNTPTDDTRSALDSFAVEPNVRTPRATASRRSESRVRRASFVSTSSRLHRGNSLEAVAAPEDVVNMNRRMRIDRAVVEDRESHYRHLILREEADALMTIASMHKNYMQQFGLLPDSPLLTPLRIASARMSFAGGTSPITFSHYDDQARERRDAACAAEASPLPPRTSLQQLRDALAEKTRQVEALQVQVRELEEAKSAAECRHRRREEDITRMRNDAATCAQNLRGGGGGGTKASAFIASRANSVPITPRRRAATELECLSPEQREAALLTENEELRALLDRRWRLMRSDSMAYC